MRSVSPCAWYRGALRVPEGPEDAWADASLCLLMDQHVVIAYPGAAGQLWGHRDGRATDHVGKRVEVFCDVLAGSVCTLAGDKKYFFRIVR